MWWTVNIYTTVTSPYQLCITAVLKYKVETNVFGSWSFKIFQTKYFYFTSLGWKRKWEVGVLILVPDDVHRKRKPRKKKTGERIKKQTKKYLSRALNKKTVYLSVSCFHFCVRFKQSIPWISVWPAVNDWLRGENFEN